MTVPNFRVERVEVSFERTLNNLMEHYLHDMAEWFEFDSSEDGSYSRSTDHFWDQGLDVFLAYAGLIPIGFAIVGSAERWIDDDNARDLDEFFVVRRYRRKGIGLAFAEHVWKLYPGKWVVRVFQNNLPALPFWRMAVSGFTGDAYDEEIREVEGNRWSYFTFLNNSP